jgi:phosphate:Na+ symporter
MTAFLREIHKMKRKMLFALALAAVIFSQAYAAKIEIVSGNKQTGVVGEKSDESLVVRVLSDAGKPLSGMRVSFRIDQEPGQPYKKGRKAELSSASAATDKNGTASVDIIFGEPKAGQYAVTAFIDDKNTVPAAFELMSVKSGWLVMVALGVLGGLGVFLFGMFFLNDSLQKVAGNKLKNLLIMLTNNPLKGLMTGLVVTGINQSSSATTVLEVSLVSVGLMTFYQSMAVTVGAEIGSTLLAQLVAFKVSDFAAIIAGLGFFITFFSKSKKIKQVGDIILSFGVLFIGMKIMSDSLSPLKTYQPFLELMENVANPIVGILVGLAFTLVVQSSGATTGIVISLALAGTITLKQAIPLNLGAMVGTCITAILGSIGRGREGKRVAFFHVLHQIAGVALVFPFMTIINYKGAPAWIHFTEWFTLTFFGTTDVTRQIAMAHTLISVFNAVWILPILRPAYRLINLVLPSKEEEKPFGPIYLDENLVATPDLALVQVRKEIVREGEIVVEMLKETINVFDCREIRLCDTVSLKDIRVDILHNAIVPYLTRIGQQVLNDEQSKEQTALLYITADVEAVGDIIDKNIMPLARKKFENKLWFSDEGWEDIMQLHTRVLKVIEHAVRAIRDNDREYAQLVANSKPEIGSYEDELRRKHIARLNAGLKESLDTSSIHIDLIDQFKRINSHTSAIGFVILS